MPRGGRREGAGRPISNQEPSKAFRLPESVGIKAKNGYYEELETILKDWEFRKESHGGKTRDWTRANELISEYQKLKEKYR